MNFARSHDFFFLHLCIEKLNAEMQTRVNVQLKSQEIGKANNQKEHELKEYQMGMNIH